MDKFEVPHLQYKGEKKHFRQIVLLKIQTAKDLIFYAVLCFQYRDPGPEGGDPVLRLPHRRQQDVSHPGKNLYWLFAPRVFHVLRTADFYQAFRHFPESVGRVLSCSSR